MRPRLSVVPLLTRLSQPAVGHVMVDVDVDVDADMSVWS